MNTKEQLTQDLKVAMKARDELRKRVLRMAISAIKNAEIAKQGQLDEPEVLALLQKEIKARHETIEGAQQAQRDDLIKTAQDEIRVLESYLPKPLSQDELTRLIRQTIAEAGATSMSEMGKVMQLLMPKIRGRADGKEANKIVRKLLS